MTHLCFEFIICHLLFFYIFHILQGSGSHSNTNYLLARFLFVYFKAYNGNMKLGKMILLFAFHNIFHELYSCDKIQWTERSVEEIWSENLIKVPLAEVRSK